MSRLLQAVVCSVALVIVLSGCAAAAGAGVAGGVYEAQNKQAMEELDRDLQAGRISREEYLRRKKAIEEKSILY